MACCILEGRGVDYAVLYCNTTDWAFGPLFDSREHAEAFVAWLPIDPRSYSIDVLEDKYSEFHRNHFECECGTIGVHTTTVDQKEAPRIGPALLCDHCQMLAIDDWEAACEDIREHERQHGEVAA